eukprot:TRINITY_DN622_c0_g1_i7.p1 TRINITY_DN622_c0_g1~~TRINITY_DN622_c0_g1_i7.p1  ORF type:complete len:326 (+),score=58.03 TRINITY_DN622_c0_g1_i7:129-1106(+)
MDDLKSILSEADRAALSQAGYRSVSDLEGVTLSTLCQDTSIDRKAAAAVLRFTKGQVPSTNSPQSSCPSHSKSETILTFCREIDSLLKGGVHTGRLTELVGPPGTGKTQLAMQLAVDVQVPVSFGGLSGSSIIIDTEGGVTAKRLRDLTSALEDHLRRNGESCKSSAELLGNIRVIRTFDFTELAGIMNILPLLVSEGDNCKLVIIDSIAAPVRGEEESFSRQQLLSLIGQRLRELAITKNIAVVTTNHTTDRQTKDTSETFTVAALGNTWSHEVSDRILLSCNPATQILTAAIEKSATLPQGTAQFRITEKGIRGAPKKPPTGG